MLRRPPPAALPGAAAAALRRPPGRPCCLHRTVGASCVVYRSLETAEGGWRLQPCLGPSSGCGSGSGGSWCQAHARRRRPCRVRQPLLIAVPDLVLGGAGLARCALRDRQKKGAQEACLARLACSLLIHRRLQVAQGPWGAPNPACCAPAAPCRHGSPGQQEEEFEAILGISRRLQLAGMSPRRGAAGGA